MNLICVYDFFGTHISHHLPFLPQPIESNLGGEHKEVATVLNNIGRVYFDIAKYPEAFSFYHESLRLRRKLLGSDHVDTSASIYNAAQASLI